MKPEQRLSDEELHELLMERKIRSREARVSAYRAAGRVVDPENAPINEDLIYNTETKTIERVSSGRAFRKVDVILLQFAVFKDSKRPDSFVRYIILVVFSTTIVYFAMKVLEPIIPINPTFIKMGVEFITNFLNYYLAKKFVFNGDQPKEEAHEA